MPYTDSNLAGRRSNGWAVASLICGILGCIPVSQLLAIVFGIVGIRKSRVTQSGKGMAIAGIVLGLLFTLGWAGCGGGAALFWVKSKPVRLASHDFLQDAAAGRTDAALARCTSGVTAEQINGFAAAASSHGAIKDITTVGLNARADASGSAWDVVGVVTFNDGQTISNQLGLTNVAGTYKVTKFIPSVSGASATAAPAATNSAQPSQTP